MAQTNAEYWAQRMKALEEALLERSYAYVENMERQFALAQKEIERDISAWYARFAANNSITLAEAKRLLNTRELQEFRWTVEEYIQHGRESVLDGAWKKQLENASARVHISRLESLRLQMQQQAEVLYGNQMDTLDAALRRSYESSYYGTAFEIQRHAGVGHTMAALDTRRIEKILSRPWTADGQTFRDRCWTNKQALVNSVNTQLTQMIIRGEAPDKAIRAISHQFDVSRAKAGRLVMTESAAIASAAQKDCYADLDVERYEIVTSLDGHVCEICGAMDGRVFRLSDFAPGQTAHPFHPWCRCTTVPYYEDMAELGERFARDANGKAVMVPGDMTYENWKKTFVQGGEKSGLTVANPSATTPQKQALVSTLSLQSQAALDVTQEYLDAATPNSHTVQDLLSYTVNGVTYTVDGHNVVLDYSSQEKGIAELLERNLGGEIFMVPRVNNPAGISTPDYLFRGARFDLKSPHGGGKNTLYDAIAKKAGQADNFVFDLTQSPLNEDEINRQLSIIYKSTHTRFVNEIIIVKNGEIFRILKRNGQTK